MGGENELGRFGCVGIASFIRKAAKLPEIGLRWSQKLPVILEPETVLDIQIKEILVASFLFFFFLSKKAISNVEEKGK